MIKQGWKGGCSRHLNHHLEDGWALSSGLHAKKLANGVPLPQPLP